jgi:3-dehydroquinate synthase
MIRLDMQLPGHPYSILTGPGALIEAGEELAAHCVSGRAAVVSDANVWGLHGQLLEAVLNRCGIDSFPVVLPPGEGSKSLAQLEMLYEVFHRSGLRRNDPVIAFGGGVIGDLAGFAASTYMRGVPFIQIPTTLLAQVDSSVGGKVAVNLPAGKNLVGSFYQPDLVVADTSLLSTLPAREWNAGMAEVIKYTALGAAELQALLEEPEKFEGNLEKIIYLCCRCKADYVEQDERDTGKRMMLNFGHTFAHAIEKHYAYSRYNHGEAVAMGMALAVRAGILLGKTASAAEKTLTALMAAYGLDYQLPEDIQVILPLMAGDKKNTDADISLILLRAMGDPFVERLAPETLRNLFLGGERGGKR